VETALVNSRVMVTGANGGLRAQFVHQALELGARKDYFAAQALRRPRRPLATTHPEPLPDH
jgi:hypothetical protein